MDSKLKDSRITKDVFQTDQISPSVERTSKSILDKIILGNGVNEFHKTLYNTIINDLYSHVRELTKSAQLNSNEKLSNELMYLSTQIYRKIIELINTQIGLTTFANNAMLLNELSEYMQKQNSKGISTSKLKYDNKTVLKNRLQAAIEKVFDNEKLNVNTLAKELALSRSNLYNKFKRILNMTPAEYILNFKLEKAESCLTKSQCTIKDAAFFAGFQDIKHFRYCFKKKYGMLPSAYIKQFKKIYKP